MRQSAGFREHTGTPFVRIDTRKCQACWKCLEECTNRVLGRINLPWHKHVVVRKPFTCTGCLKCVKTCEYGACSKPDAHEA